MIADLEARRPGEPLQLEAERLALASERAPAARTLRQERTALAAQLARLEAALGAGAGGAVVNAARAVARRAGPLGLVSLAAIARDVMITAERGDAAGLAATTARLFRHGRRALEMLDELHLISSQGG